ncbi:MULTISPECIES: C-GCAxxG-C-C family (seleno)protein [unclassified Clostridioides]|uniref:C-GCAxxG-C-C family (seleno)protein n=1 Tax=unclassified Clostridioides TaxID=2635829 RepID=UPI001D0CD778|nr:C-GCAxxG-C-C family protein [Clostridioides sp. ES-S-0001-02]MCC0639829.1 C-GCAxxG-C-C family protein [Clostridioides sp. ES-S-0049-03]MCC0653576.1 C-GCAxxG-C-C family protein [Clostridioides sp. ES-S-0001-03]MCC0655323.1 C-GCAxxG-C-C family protein [Clostridioides sp. ES-S-0123-01]MCC0671298.1 C-GCAxxG-C-C family protein [Clostridioides sp. ES-S-0145-01]MCC0674894.1 C-GCAxxG-C-C family protein [Clostridioides sp. ES-W-0018-02]MCC0679424.1 C-GCAxxG-C-C family protein [Clostridioides sp. ES
MTRPSIYHSQGYTCAEALIKSYNEEHETDIPISIGSGMGVGITVGSVCGAVNAAVVIIGYLNGRNNNLDENMARKYSRELMNKVRAKYSTEICASLKKNKVSCGEIINFTYDALNDILEDQK